MADQDVCVCVHKAPHKSAWLQPAKHQDVHFWVRACKHTHTHTHTHTHLAGKFGAVRLQDVQHWQCSVAIKVEGLAALVVVVQAVLNACLRWNHLVEAAVVKGLVDALQELLVVLHEDFLNGINHTFNNSGFYQMIAAHELPHQQGCTVVMSLIPASQSLKFSGPSRVRMTSALVFRDGCACCMGKERILG
eukprot:1157151-Pelagomonas_calceolata.AAC.4